MKRLVKHMIINLMLIVSLILLVGCKKEPQDTSPETALESISENTSDQEEIVEESGPTQEELDAMWEEAKECHRTARFEDEISIYRELYSYGYADKDFSDRGIDEAIEIREGKYIRNSIVCQQIEYAVKALKDVLKDPNSLVLYKVLLKEDDVDKSKLIIVFDYGATNSFGAMVRNEYTYTAVLTDKQKTKIYESLKKYMDADGATSDDSARYLIGNYSVLLDTQYEAIVEGTCNYGNFSF